MFELCLTLVWSYLMLAMALLWLVHFILPVPALAVVSSPFYRMVAVFYWGDLSHSVCFKQMDG